MAVTDTTDLDRAGARQRILDVTAALVLEHGVAGVAQRQIAEQVSIKAASPTVRVMGPRCARVPKGLGG